MLPLKGAPVSAAELIALMQRHGLEQEVVAQMIGTSTRLVRRYIDDEKPIPEPTARLLRILVGEASIQEYYR